MRNACDAMPSSYTKRCDLCSNIRLWNDLQSPVCTMKTMEHQVGYLTEDMVWYRRIPHLDQVLAPLKVPLVP